MRLTAALLLTISLSLSGCTIFGGDDEDDDVVTPTPTPSDPVFPTPTTPTNVTPTPATPNLTLDSSTYSLAVSGVPTQVKPNATFNFTLYANGSVTAESDHIGAHYADNDTVDPPVTPGRQDCDHVSGALPGTYNVTCRFTTIGTWYVWGHARINNSGQLHNWWTADASIVKARDYDLTLGSVPTNSQASGSNFTVQVNVTALGASENVTSDHIGVLYWNASEPNPTAQNAAGACQHVSGGVVGSHTITCNIANAPGLPKEFFLRGHVRITEGATSLEWFSAEQKVSVLGALPGIPG